MESTKSLEKNVEEIMRIRLVFSHIFIIVNKSHDQNPTVCSFVRQYFQTSLPSVALRPKPAGLVFLWDLLTIRKRQNITRLTFHLAVDS